MPNANAVMRVRCASCLLLFLSFSFAASSVNGGSFAIVVLPDTQMYAQQYPNVFQRQTEWIAANAERLNIRFVTHLGDVVNESDSPAQWNVAAAAMAHLDPVVPWGIVPGNHDLDSANNKSGGAEAYRKPFGAKRFEGKPWMAACSPNGLNTAQTFTGGGRKYLFLHLEIDPSDETIRWAENVLRSFPRVPTLLTTHVYLTRNGRDREKTPSCRGADGNSAQALWDEFVSTHPQIFMVFCGHWCVENVLLSENRADSVTIQMIADYQNRPNGGNGWLRLLTFDPDNGQIRVSTYSPWLDRYETDADSQFTIPLDFPNRFGRPLESTKEQPQ